jgi:uncharacterized membrane protein HdeD (DUF308 family)
MFNNKIEGIGKWSSFLSSIIMVLGGIFLFFSDTTIVEVLIAIGFLCIVFAICIWISLYRQWDERRIEERVKKRIQS